MFSIVKHSLWEQELVHQIIEFIDGPGNHSDFPILIEESDPQIILNFISFQQQNHNEEQFFVRCKDQSLTRKSWRYMTRNFPQLVFNYFQDQPQPANIYWEDWRIIESISWNIQKDIVRFFLLEHPYGQRFWVSSFFIHAHFPNFVLWEYLYLRNK